MRSARGSRLAAAVALLVLCLVMASCGGGGDDGSTAGGQSSATPEAPPHKQIENHLSARQRQRTAVVARVSPEVKSVLGTRRRRTGDAVPVTNADGSKLEAVIETVNFNPAIDMDHRRLPAQIQPNRLAPAGTPPLSRSYSCTATGVTRLEVRVELATGRVVEIIPAGPRAKVTEMKLLGPPLSRIYKPITED